MNVHSATCSCSVELFKQWFTLTDFFAKLGYFAGFSLNIIYIVGRISAAAIAGNIKLLSLGDLVRDYTGAYTVIYRGIISPKEQQSCKGRRGGGGQGRGTLFF